MMHEGSPDSRGSSTGNSKRLQAMKVPPKGGSFRLSCKGVEVRDTNIAADVVKKQSMAFNK